MFIKRHYCDSYFVVGGHSEDCVHHPGHAALLLTCILIQLAYEVLISLLFCYIYTRNLRLNLSYCSASGSLLQPATRGSALASRCMGDYCCSDPLRALFRGWFLISGGSWSLLNSYYVIRRQTMKWSEDGQYRVHRRCFWSPGSASVDSECCTRRRRTATGEPTLQHRTRTRRSCEGRSILSPLF